MKKLIIALSLFFLTATAYANTVSQDCGCGLGRVLIGEKEGLVWNLLGTCLNGTMGNNTFGMTTGTLGCDTGGKIVINEKIDIFVADNMDNLAIDIAAGHGETLEALAEIAMVGDKAGFFNRLQASFDNIYPDEEVSSEQVAGKITALM